MTSGAINLSRVTLVTCRWAASFGLKAVPLIRRLACSRVNECDVTDILLGITFFMVLSLELVGKKRHIL